MLLCLGIGYGPVILVGDRDVFGAEVNAASKLGEDTAGPGEVLVTEALVSEVGEVLGVSYEPIDYVPPGAAGAYRALYPLDPAGDEGAG